MLVRILYASRSSETIDESLLRSILEQSRRGNLQNGVTGLLCVQRDSGVFLQVLEGARDVVNELYTRIVRDPRHHDVTIIAYDEIEERLFSSWRMGSVDMNSVNRGSILRYSERAVLDPFVMSGQRAVALLSELADSAAVISND